MRFVRCGFPHFLFRISNDLSGRTTAKALKPRYRREIILCILDCGCYRAMGTPFPIPNREVKHRSTDDT